MFVIYLSSYIQKLKFLTALYNQQRFAVQLSLQQQNIVNIQLVASYNFTVDSTGWNMTTGH